MPTVAVGHLKKKDGSRTESDKRTEATEYIPVSSISSLLVCEVLALQVTWTERPRPLAAPVPSLPVLSVLPSDLLTAAAACGSQSLKGETAECQTYVAT